MAANFTNTESANPMLGRLTEEIQQATADISRRLYDYSPVQIAYLSGLGYGTITAIRRGETKQAQPETLDAIWRAMEKAGKDEVEKAQEQEREQALRRRNPE